MPEAACGLSIRVNGRDEPLMAVTLAALLEEKTVDTGKTHFYSRSRRSMWLKGESSGHFQEVREILMDCDADALLVKVIQKVAACHMGYRSCFFRRRQPDGSIEEVGEKVFDPEQTYK